jgi:hypothetical protein
MIDEGFYLFFDKEIPAQRELLPAFVVINVSNSFRQDIKNYYMRFEFDSSDKGQHAGLKAVGERKFLEYCRRTRTVLFVCTKSLVELEFALAESVKAVDRFREIISNDGFMFVAEIWDASFFWTGASIQRWFRSRFPLKPKAPKYANPPSVLDLLYEFLESVSHSQDNLLTLKEALPALDSKDQLFVENILGGKNPSDSKQTQDTSARILRALMERTICSEPKCMLTRSCRLPGIDWRSK